MAMRRAGRPMEMRSLDKQGRKVSRRTKNSLRGKAALCLTEDLMVVNISSGPRKCGVFGATACASNFDGGVEPPGVDPFPRKVKGTDGQCVGEMVIYAHEPQHAAKIHRSVTTYSGQNSISDTLRGYHRVFASGVLPSVLSPAGLPSGGSIPRQTISLDLHLGLIEDSFGYTVDANRR
jgi:hypothetical protein